MNGIPMLIVGIIVFMLLLLVVRWIGAWLLRIDDVISEVTKIRKMMEKDRDIR